MQFNFRLFGLSLAVLFAHFPANAENLYDIEQFEVAGVRVGQSMEEAMEALKNHYTIDTDDIRVKYFLKPLSITGDTDVPRELSYRPKGTNVYVLLQPTLEHPDKGPVVVSSISIEIFRYTAADWLKELVETFGPYTLIKDQKSSEESWSYQWCTKVHGLFTECDPKFPVLRLDDDEIILFSPTYRMAWREEEKKWKEIKGIK